MVRFFLSLAILVGSVPASQASAKTPRIVVLGFSGPGGSTARTQVVRALRGRADFATKADADRVLDRQGLKASSAAGRATLATELDVDYVFWGRVKGKGKSARTEIRVAGRSGDALTGYEAGAPGTTQGNAQIQEAARTALAEAKQLAPPEERRRDASDESQ